MATYIDDFPSGLPFDGGRTVTTMRGGNTINTSKKQANPKNLRFVVPSATFQHASRPYTVFIPQYTISDEHIQALLAARADFMRISRSTWSSFRYDLQWDFGPRFVPLTRELASRLQGLTVPIVTGQEWMDHVGEDASKSSYAQRGDSVLPCTIHGEVEYTPGRTWYGAARPSVTECMITELDEIGPKPVVGKQLTYPLWLSEVGLFVGGDHEYVMVWAGAVR
jgi:hypothetical protein